jgi:hypothetical protein
MNNTDKAVKALNMKGIDAGFLNKGHTSQLAIGVKGVDFALHEDEIAKWADTYDELVAAAPIEAADLIRESLVGTVFTDKIRDNLKAALDLLDLYSEHNRQ